MAEAGAGSIVIRAAITDAERRKIAERALRENVPTPELIARFLRDGLRTKPSTSSTR